nr:uncharacterized protein LOC107276723 isoform X2 [Oryza sativa Japonica Group]
MRGDEIDLGAGQRGEHQLSMLPVHLRHRLTLIRRQLFFHGGDEGEAVAAAAHAPRPPARGGGGDQDAAVAGAADAPRPPAIGGGAVGREAVVASGVRGTRGVPL